MKIEVDLNPASQFVTAYCDGKPVATLIRRRVYADGPIWRCYHLDGSLMFQTMFTLTDKRAAQRIAHHLTYGVPA